MSAFIIYEIKVAVALAVFMLFYKLLLQKDTFHRFNRIVLLATSALAFVLPFMVIVRHKTIVSEAQYIDSEAFDTIVPTDPGFIVMPFLEICLYVVFFAGAAFMLIRIAYSIFKIRQLIASGRKIPQEDGTVIVVVNDNDFSPVSWMKYIVMSEEDYSSTGEGILIHERAHIALRHSWDILFFDLMTVMQWFNPAIWLLKADLRAIHEYEADEAVITAGTDMREYQLLLVRKAVAKVRYQIANSLNHSTLKNRIKMMTSKRSSLYGALKALYVLPLVAVSLAVNAKTRYDYVNDKTEEPAATVRNKSGESDEKRVYIVNGKAVSEINSISPDKIESMTIVKDADAIAELKEKHNLNGDVTCVINVKLEEDGAKADGKDEVPPTFQGGDLNKFSKWVNMQVMYPAEAKAAKVQGRVNVKFVVTEKGKAEKVEALNEVHPALAAEAVRVVSSSTGWTPAYIDGKPVEMTLVMPVIFRIAGQEAEKADDGKSSSLKIIPEGGKVLNGVVAVSYPTDSK